MSNHAFHFEDPLRPIYEYYSIMSFIGTGVVCIWMLTMTEYPKLPLILVFALCMSMMAYRWVGAQRLIRLQKALSGTKVRHISRDQIQKSNENSVKKGASPSIYFGKGFAWTQEHAQLSHTITRQDPNRLIPFDDETFGQPWIHGLNSGDEIEVRLPLDHTAGHLLLLGTTRAGKSRTLDLIITQAVQRNEAVFIWDPKGDPDLYASLQNALIAAGREEDCIYFHPAFPQKSARIDPLMNFSRATELATRVASLIPSETGADPFTAHSMMVLTNICAGLLMIHQKPTLRLLKRYVDSGVDGIVVKASEAFFDKNIPGWKQEAQAYLQRAKARVDREIAIAYINFYRDVVATRFQSTELEGLYSDFEHDKSHQAKMTASLTPVLTMLTSGAIGDLLSPDPEKDDDRIITDFARIIRNGQGCYIGLDTMSDNMVGSAIGSMFISDMTAVSGQRYNYEDVKKIQYVNLIVDEAAELVSDKLIQLLNKAGGSRIRLIIASQTFADFAARTGSEAKARQVVANLNNILALRMRDDVTQKYVSDQFPLTYVRHIEYSQGTSTATSNMLDFGYKLGEAVVETEVPLVKPQMFGCLSNLEYFLYSSGRLMKGRLELLDNTPVQKNATKH